MLIIAIIVLLLSSNISLNCIYQEINVFGDSHALFSFGNITSKSTITKRIHQFYRYNNNIQKAYKPFPSSNTNYLYQHNNKTVRFIVCSFFGETMYNISKKQNDFFNFYNLTLNNTIILFNFGEVDCRYHIGRQIKEKNRSLNEVIDQLILNYVNFIKKIQNQTKSLIIISSIIPPSNMTFNPKAPYYGSIQERAMITDLLNLKLKNACVQNNILFIDPYVSFRDENSFLIEKFSDKIVHVDPNLNYITKNILLDVLAAKQLI